MTLQQGHRHGTYNTYCVLNAVRLYGVVDRSAEEHLTLLQV